MVSNCGESVTVKLEMISIHIVGGIEYSLQDCPYFI